MMHTMAGSKMAVPALPEDCHRRGHSQLQSKNQCQFLIVADILSLNYYVKKTVAAQMRHGAVAGLTDEVDIVAQAGVAGRHYSEIAKGSTHDLTGDCVFAAARHIRLTQMGLLVGLTDKWMVVVVVATADVGRVDRVVG